jgi:hypothetical protein
VKQSLLKRAWANSDPHELRLLLDKHIGGPGQYDRELDSINKLYLPLARSSCRIVLTFHVKDKRITTIEPGQAFDTIEWARVSEEIDKSILCGTPKFGRDFSFSGHRVLGSWRGPHSEVQILPAPSDAPRAPYEMADHPFILEFPMKASDFWPITNYRRMREHRNLTLLLNVLLVEGTSFQPRRSGHFWASVPREGREPEIKWVQQFYFASLGEIVFDQLPPLIGEHLEEVEPEQYYGHIGVDGKGLRVPTDLDDLIYRYQKLSASDRAKFDRATFWMDLANRQWTISTSASFASLVSAVEALTDRGIRHHVYCKTCGKDQPHDVPGATQKFQDFFEQYAPGRSLSSRRSKMYGLRSGILHGSDLMQLDQDRDFGWDPPGWNERQLHMELWSLARMAMRTWLKGRPEERNS